MARPSGHANRGRRSGPAASARSPSIRNRWTSSSRLSGSLVRRAAGAAVVAAACWRSNARPGRGQRRCCRPAPGGPVGRRRPGCSIGQWRAARQLADGVFCLAAQVRAAGLPLAQLGMVGQRSPESQPCAARTGSSGSPGQNIRGVADAERNHRDVRLHCEVKRAVLERQQWPAWPTSAPGRTQSASPSSRT